MGAAITLVPHANLLRHTTTVTDGLTVTLTDGKKIPPMTKGTLILTCTDGSNLTLNDAYVANGTTEIIISALQLLKWQNLQCTINRHTAYVYSERQENDVMYELERHKDVLRFRQCIIKGNTAHYTTMGDDTTNVQQQSPAIEINDKPETCTSTRESHLNPKFINKYKFSKGAPTPPVVTLNKWLNDTNDESSLRTRQTEKINAHMWHRRLGHPCYKLLPGAHKYAEGIVHLGLRVRRQSK